jgi:hypothetical protein
MFSLLLPKPSLPKKELCFLWETLHEETLLLPNPNGRVNPIYFITSTKMK